MKKKLFLIPLFFSVLLFSQKKQPKVGLVLSGGGAKGFAHISVLKEIDKAGVQLDYIGGTSMGAIVGGLYAAGYSGIEIEKITQENDFLKILTDQLPRNSTPFFEKEYGENTAITFPVKKGVVGLPKGVSKGQSILNLLLELLTPVNEISDFSKLPIPFFCIGTDIENGTQVLLDKGSLPLALRASGSFPTLLNPVEIGDKVLVDGGITNNFPVDIMGSKNMDIIIGVDVEGKLYKKEKLTSAVSILNQIVSYQMYRKSDKEKENVNIYIHPDIYEYSVVDFEKKEEILEKGEEAVKEFAAVFKEIAGQQKRKKKVKKIRLEDRKYSISQIEMSGNKNYTRAYILGKLNIKDKDSISRSDITKKIHLLSATKNFERIEYTLEKKVDNSYRLDFLLVESDEKASLKLGVHYDELYKSGVLATYSQKKALIKNDLFSLGLILGDNIRYKLNYFVDNGFYTSFGFRSSYNHFTTNTKFSAQNSAVNRINFNFNNFNNQFFIQTTFDRKFALGLGLEHKFVRITTETITTNNAATIFDNSHYFNAFTYLKLDSYDDKIFPTRGYFADLNAKWYLLSSNYNKDFSPFLQMKGTVGFAATMGSKFTFQNTNEAGFTLNNPTSTVFDFYLGGYNKNYINTFISFYGYDFAELSEQTFLKSEFNFRYNFLDKHYAVFIANYGRLDNNVFKDIDIFENIKSGYAIGYSYNTLIGPIELKYSWSPDNNQKYWLFNLGFWF